MNVEERERKRPQEAGMEWKGKEAWVAMEENPEERERERSKGKAKLREVMNKKRDLHL